MEAIEIVALFDKVGMGGLLRQMGCTRREGEALLTRARRACANGAGRTVLVAEGSTWAAQARQRQKGAERPQEGSGASARPGTAEATATAWEGEARTRARRILALEGGHRLSAEGELAGRINVLASNVKAGYLEWVPELNMLRKTQELVRSGNAV